MASTADQNVTTVLLEVLRVALHLVQSGQVPARAPRKVGGKKAAAGIYPHTSKYNPWRAYVWDKTLKKTIYLGAFPSIAKAKQAQREYRSGLPITSGTHTAPHAGRKSSAQVH